MQRKFIALFAVCVLLPDATQAFAATVKGKAPANYHALLVSGSKAAASSGNSFSLKSPASSALLYLVNSSGTLAGPVIGGIKYKGVYYSYKDGKKYCRKSGAKILLGLKTPGSKTLSLGAVKYNASGFGYLSTLPATSSLTGSTAISNKSNCAPAGTGSSLGLSAQHSTVFNKRASKVHVKANSDDSDGDGLANPLDVDQDGDGILNAYDSDTTSGGTSSFRIFSNLKLEIGNSLNAYTQTLDDTQIDTAAGQLGLAIQVAGSGTDTTELNCSGLSYCSTGGTGTSNSGAFPDSVDSDADGFGTITEGPTGDFQLQPHVTASSSIAAGDTYVEIVTDSGSKETEIPGMLNFVFRTTPAITSVTMGATTSTPTYPANPSMLGSTNNPFVAPGGWDGLLTLTAYRPQRPGISGAGEGAYVDIGKSLITIDVPNAPCSASSPGGCGGTGPGNCTAAAYSETDSNLTSDPNGLLDTRADQDTNTSAPSSNTVTFTIDVDACLAAHSLTLGSGEKVALDLQFRNEFGDNAAQKFYISRP